MMSEYRHLAVEPSTGSEPDYKHDRLSPFTGTMFPMFPGAWLFSQVSVAYHAIDPQTRFARHAQEWHADTDHLSSVRQIAMHDGYQKIIGMGPMALPYIFEELRNHGGQWYWALRAIADTSPVPDDALGDIPRMKAAWLRWGAEHGYIFPE